MWAPIKASSFPSIPPPKSFEARFQKLANTTTPKTVNSTFSPKPENYSTAHDYIDALIKYAERSLELCLCSTGLSSLTVPGPVHKKLSSTLQVVDLSKNNIQEVPYLIRDCISLNRLYLPFNKLQHSPPGHFSHLASSLTVLDLSDNLLVGTLFDGDQPSFPILDVTPTIPYKNENMNPKSTGISTEMSTEISINSQKPSNFIKFPQLRKLNVSNNKLTSLSPSPATLKVQFPQLLQLNASKNELATLSEALPLTIVHADFSSNKLVSIDNVNWADLYRLNNLNLAANDIKYLPKSLYFIRQSLKLLKLDWNCIEIQNRGRGLRHILNKDQIFWDEEKRSQEIQDLEKTTQNLPQNSPQNLPQNLPQIEPNHEKQSSTVSTASETRSIEVNNASTMTDNSKIPQITKNCPKSQNSTTSDPKSDLNSDLKSDPNSSNQHKTPGNKNPGNYRDFDRNPNTMVVRKTGSNPEIRVRDTKITQNNSPNRRRREAVDNYKKIANNTGMSSIKEDENKKFESRVRQKSKDKILVSSNGLKTGISKKVCSGQSSSNISKITEGASVAGKTVAAKQKQIEELRDFMNSYTVIAPDPELIKSDGDLALFLSDGVYLCQLVNRLCPNSINPIHLKPQGQKELNILKRRNNVNNFIRFYLDTKSQYTSTGHPISTKPVCSASFILEKRSLGNVAQIVMILADFLMNHKPKKKRSAGPISTAPTARTKATISSASSTPKLRTEDNSASSSSSRSSQQSNSSPRSNKTGVSVTQRYPAGNNGYV